MLSRIVTSKTPRTVRLGAGDWRVWRSSLVRAAGFPAGRLAELAAPDAARAADELLDQLDRLEQSDRLDRTGTDADTGLEIAFDAAFARATARISRAAYELAGEPLFREAITWQNPDLVRTVLDPLRSAGAAGPRNSSRRQKETAVAQYWSRYCAKNDTIGFFGPVCWAEADDTVSGVVAKPGARLVRSRHVYLERWALGAFADRLAEDPAIRPLLPVALPPTVTLHGRTLIHPTRGEVRLNQAEAVVAGLCDGRSARDVADLAAADPASGLRRPENVFLTLSGLAERELVIWGIELPIGLRAGSVLRQAIDSLPDEAVRRRARAGYDELAGARDAVAEAAGDPDRLAAAMSALGATFTRLTGREPSRAHGRMYAGRTVCFEDTVRDLDVTIGRNALDALARPLDLLLTSARWLGCAVADRYAEQIRSVYDELAAELEREWIPFTELMFLVQGYFYGPGRKPVDEVAEDFLGRWSTLLGLDADAREIRLRSEDLAAGVAEVFDAGAPAWSGARFHSPDLHLLADASAPDALSALADGEVSAVLGELHAAWNTLDSDFFVERHPEPESLTEALSQDLATQRVLPLLPESWPRLTARTAIGMRLSEDRYLAWVPAPGADRAAVLPSTGLTVGPAEDGEGLVVAGPDGRRRPIVEVFAGFLATCAVDAFKLFGSFPHSPRVWIDRLVVHRESWCRQAGELGFTALNDERARYLRARRWQRELGLPDRVFVKLGTEVKPIYVDLTSPVYVRVLSMAVRAALRDGGPQTPVTICEMLPTPEQAWVPDADGNRYAGEVRLVVVDPVPARTATASGAAR